MRRQTPKPELLSPAGSFDALIAAVDAGADAVYFGGSSMNARAFAKNFDAEEMERAILYCRTHGVRAYVTLNTALTTRELPDALRYAAFLREAGVDVPEISTVGAHVYVSRDGIYMGAICVSDCVREDAARSVAALRAMGISPLVLLSGDRREAAEAVGKALSLDRVYGACTPERKAEYLAEERRACDRAFLFVGDGINDAPVLAAADCGVAMGALGTDAAKYAADVVLLTDGIAGVADAIRIARKTVRIVKANIVFILAVKGAVMLLSAATLVGMWAAVFADVGVSVISILNAARAARIGRK
jgi:Cd2+/Zn2+-exporting ATPase